MAQFDARSMIEAATGAGRTARGPRRIASPKPPRLAAAEPVVHGAVADRAGRRRAHDRVRAGRADRHADLRRLRGAAGRRSSGTTSAPSPASRVLAMLAFQAADIYQVQAFRGHEKQYFRLASAWSVVFLIVIGVSFFAKAGDQFSRVWLGSFYVIGLVALLGVPPRAVPAGAALDPRRPARPAHRRSSAAATPARR